MGPGQTHTSGPVLSLPEIQTWHSRIHMRKTKRSNQCPPHSPLTPAASGSLSLPLIVPLCLEHPPFLGCSTAACFPLLLRVPPSPPSRLTLTGTASPRLPPPYSPSTSPIHSHHVLRAHPSSATFSCRFWAWHCGLSFGTGSWFCDIKGLNGA